MSNWQEEFNKKFCSKTSEPKYSVWNAAALAYPEEIKSFIENLLEQERQRMSEEIEGLHKRSAEFEDFSSATVDEVLSIIK